jgi:hypothetical protein
MGIGDVYPAGALRLISGIEGINGLFLGRMVYLVHLLCDGSALASTPG